eukprot:jgi/Chlat1/5208/Chrsp33S05180
MRAEGAASVGDLLALLQDLGERGTGQDESSMSTAGADLAAEDPVELRFRSVLKELMQQHFSPAKAKEREVLAISKLIALTARRYGGVFFHGQAKSVLPIVSSILPLLAEPHLRPAHGALLDTLCVLLSMLRSGDRQSYCRMFAGLASTLEDVADIASYLAQPSRSDASAVWLQSCRAAYAVLENSDDPNGPGILINVSTAARCCSLACCVVATLARCMREAPVYVSGLLAPASIHAITSLLRCSTPMLHKACCEALPVLLPELHPATVPWDDVVCAVLDLLLGVSSTIRTGEYDNAMAHTLEVALYCGGESAQVVCWEYFPRLFPQVVLSTTSGRLQVVLCKAFQDAMHQRALQAEDVNLLFPLLGCDYLHPLLVNCICEAFSDPAAVAARKPALGEVCEPSPKRRRITAATVMIDAQISAPPLVVVSESSGSIATSLEAAIRECGPTKSASNDAAVDQPRKLVVLRALGSAALRLGSPWQQQVHMQLQAWLLHVQDAGHSAKAALISALNAALPDVATPQLPVTFPPKALDLVFGECLTKATPEERNLTTARRLMPALCKLLHSDHSIGDWVGRLVLTIITDGSLLAEGLNALPFCMQQTGANVLSPEACISALRHMRAPSAAIDKEALAWSLGRLACRTNPNARQPRVLHDHSQAGMKRYWVACTVCDLHQAEISEDSPPTTDAIISLVLPLCEDNNPAALHNANESLRRAINACLVHRSVDVRLEIANSMQALLQDKVLAALHPGVDKHLAFLDLLRKPLTAARSALACTLLQAFAAIAMRTTGTLQVASLVTIMDQLDHADMVVRSTAVDLLRGLGTDGVKALVESHKQVIYEFLCRHLVKRPALVEEFAEEVCGMSLKDLVKLAVPVVIPKLAQERAIDVLEGLAQRLDSSVPGLLVEWCHVVLAWVLLRANGDAIMQVLEFYELQTKQQAMVVFLAVLPPLLDELVQSLGDNSTESACRRAARLPAMIQEVAEIATGSNDLPTFLKSHFVGLLTSIDRNMLRSKDSHTQAKGVRCIEGLINMIGQHLSAFVPKLMALLAYALTEPHLRHEALKAFGSFVMRLGETSPATLSSVASQMVVALMPCLEEPPGSLVEGAAASVLATLIVDHQQALSSIMCDLPVLPHTDALAPVNAVLDRARGTVPLTAKLQRAVNGLRHESLSVRWIALLELRQLLSHERTTICQMSLAERVDPVLAQILTALLKGCSAVETRLQLGQRVQLLCADCLGELGALDPARIQIDLSQLTNMERSNDDLVVKLISDHLSKLFRAASESNIQDAAALAIQEILKLYNCDSAQGSGVDKDLPTVSHEPGFTGAQLWQALPTEVQEVIAPCLSSKFRLTSSPTALPPGAIYKPGLSFRRWMYNWSRRLYAETQGRRAKVYEACLGIIRHDMETAMFLLPHAVFAVLCTGSQAARYDIKMEILAVLNDEPAGMQPVQQRPDKNGAEEVSLQAVFLLLDRMGQWLDSCNEKLYRASVHKLSIPEQVQKELKDQAKHVQDLIVGVPYEVLARAASRCRAHARTLLYMEQHLRHKAGARNPARVYQPAPGQTSDLTVYGDQDITFLQEVYRGLDEPDGLLGFLKLRQQMLPEDKIVISEQAGAWAEALTGYEQSLRADPFNLTNQLGMLNCLLNLGHLQALTTAVDGLLVRLPDQRKKLCNVAIEAAWRLGDWQRVDEYLQPWRSTDAADCGFGVELAKILLEMQRSAETFGEKLVEAKKGLLPALSAASMESHVRAYPTLVRLHMLQELNEAQCALSAASDKQVGKGSLSLSSSAWDERLQMTQPSLWAREPVIAVRRLLFSQIGNTGKEAECWLLYAKLCRAVGHHETAALAILEAGKHEPATARLEHAKLLWEMRQPHRAIDELQALMPQVISVNNGGDTVSVAAKSVLLLARWVHHTGQSKMEDVIALFKKAQVMAPTWEKSYFYLAKYCDDLFADARQRQRQLENSKEARANQRLAPEAKHYLLYLPDVLAQYAKALRLGHRQIFQSLPRMLTLWFEFGALNLEDASPVTVSHAKAVGPAVTTIVRDCATDVPAYAWLTALPQLISRILHRNAEVTRLLSVIISKVVGAFPLQALWPVVAVSRSAVAARREQAGRIIQASKQCLKEKGCKLLKDYQSFIDEMIRLCAFGKSSKKPRLIIRDDFATLFALLPVEVLMPVQSALTVALPASGRAERDFKPFAGNAQVTICRIHEEVELMASLMKPKKITLTGSDGQEYLFLCKPKDDLRKDNRLMEFTTMINRLLKKDPESRRRKLYMRSFAVLPLTEDCGMIEWVQHTRGLRHILEELYTIAKCFDKYKTNGNIKKYYDSREGQNEVETLLKILKLFPSILHRWFLSSFPEPAAWFRSRLAYSRTTAVWAMVGHMVGLGDRHGENVLFDSTTGDCVHVDFSCLFDKGLELAKPEMVPFRLTQNIVDGLGVAGTEGVFQRICEVTLKVLRNNRETLMTVMDTFVHDPLVEWTKSHRSSLAEMENPQAHKAMANIEARLRGVVVGVNAQPSLPLSVEGQARRLIEEASSLQNLAKMYIWWMPWF